MPNKKLNIAVLSFYSGINKRGVEMWVYELFKRLGERCDVTVFQVGKNIHQASYKTKIVNSYYPKLLDQTSVFGFSRRLYLDHSSLRVLNFTLKTIPEIWRQNFDIVISTDGGWEPGVIRLLTWLRGKKMVVVGHSGKGWDERNNLFSFPDTFVALSEFAKDWVKKVNPLIRVVKIPNGVDANRFSPEGQKLDLKLERPIYLTVAALEPEKRIDFAVRSVAKLTKGSLIVLGSGSMEEETRTMLEKLLPGRHMIKSVQFDEIPAYFRSCDVFTLPSWKNEAFGIVYLEALSSGLPVVATDDMIRREIVGNAGLFVDPENIVEYSNALARIVKMNLRQRALKQAEKFSWEKVSDKYFNLFTSMNQ